MSESYLRFAIIPLRILAVLYTSLTVFFYAVFDFTTSPASLFPVLFLALALLSVILLYGLEQKKRWAWTASIGFFVLHLPSGAGFVLGGLGLCGLLAQGSREEFGIA